MVAISACIHLQICRTGRPGEAGRHRGGALGGGRQAGQDQRRRSGSRKGSSRHGSMGLRTAGEAGHEVAAVSATQLPHALLHRR